MSTNRYERGNGIIESSYHRSVSNRNKLIQRICSRIWSIENSKLYFMKREEIHREAWNLWKMIMRYYEHVDFSRKWSDKEQRHCLVVIIINCSSAKSSIHGYDHKETQKRVWLVVGGPTVGRENDYDLVTPVHWEFCSGRQHERNW
jgi:hypothetical protein